MSFKRNLINGLACLSLTVGGLSGCDNPMKSPDPELTDDQKMAKVLEFVEDRAKLLKDACQVGEPRPLKLGEKKISLVFGDIDSGFTVSRKIFRGPDHVEVEITKPCSGKKECDGFKFTILDKEKVPDFHISLNGNADTSHVSDLGTLELECLTYAGVGSLSCSDMSTDGNILDYFETSNTDMYSRMRLALEGLVESTRSYFSGTKACSN